MNTQKEPTILIVPGLRDHVADHWQTHLETKLSTVRKVVSVPPLETDKLSCEARVQAIERTMRKIDGPVIVVAHSGGVVMLVHWAQKYAADIQGALLAAAPDFATPLPAGYPALEVLEANGWLPLPRKALTFRSIVAASTNDPLASLESVELMARDWDSELVNLGAVGHLNPASGFGVWPQAEQFIQMLER
ncbi:MAG: alpha/beta hydrolase [Collimonas sp.]|uniref:RBBP9/YdeN family alpha/beta hydrolase n=1 Tax=Collimonas sp. TaxID=1963772 RepID=UPI0032664E07